MIEFISNLMKNSVHQSRIVTLLSMVTAVWCLSCSSSKSPGVWVPQDTGTGDSFSSVNFVNENIGWLNGRGERNPEPEQNENSNKKPKKPEKIVDPLKENQGFEVLRTTDGGQTWRQIP